MRLTSSTHSSASNGQAMTLAVAARRRRQRVGPIAHRSFERQFKVAIDTQSPLPHLAFFSFNANLQTSHYRTCTSPSHRCDSPRPVSQLPLTVRSGRLRPLSRATCDVPHLVLLRHRSHTLEVSFICVSIAVAVDNCLFLPRWTHPSRPNHIDHPSVSGQPRQTSTRVTRDRYA